MSQKEKNDIAEAIAYLAEQFQHSQLKATGSENIVESLDKIAHSLWDGLRAEGGDATIPNGLFAIAKSLDLVMHNGLFAIARSLDKVAEAINNNRGGSK